MSFLLALVLIVAGVFLMEARQFFFGFVLVFGAVLLILAKVFGKTASGSVKVAKSLSTGIGEEAEKTEPASGLGETVADISKAMGEKAGELVFAPDSHRYKSKGLMERVGKGAGDFVGAFFKLFK